MTYRERRIARAERLRGWALARDQKAERAYTTAHSTASMIPLGQPILVGYHSEGRHRRDLAKIDTNMRRSIEHGEKAEQMRSRADNINAQLEQSIYSDDPDAIPRLEEKLAGLEARRERIKNYNKSCRKGKPDTSLLTDKMRASLEETARVAPYFLGTRGQFPSYALSNLSGRIKATKDRLAHLKRQKEANEKR